MMKKLLYAFVLLFAFTFAQGKNDIKARLEFEEAEKSFSGENYETALKHLNQTEKELGRWTPNVSYLKIESLYALTDMGIFTVPTMQHLYEEVTKYMAYLNKLEGDDVPIDKYKVVYGIEKTMKALKFEERQSPEFIRAKDEKDDKTSITLNKPLADNGNSWAIRNIGVCYENLKELDQAFLWYQKALDSDNAQSAIDLSECNFTGGKDEARKWHEKAAKMGHPYGVYAMGWYAENIDNNLQKAMEYYQQAADLGSALALYKIGKKYEDDKDYTKSILHYKQAVAKGNLSAMYNLGVLFFDGSGVEKNTQLAMEYWLTASNHGKVEAMYLIGWVHEEGHGGYAKDYKKAEEWYLKAAIINPYFYSYLGQLYSLSDNNNLQKALEYYEKVAEAGYLNGMLESAHLYFSGKGGITKNYTKAAKYYEDYYNDKKKNEGYIDNLIEIYSRGGHGVEKDKEKARYWKAIRKK